VGTYIGLISLKCCW